MGSEEKRNEDAGGKEERGDSTDEPLKRAQKLYEEERYSEAVGVFSAALRQDPQSAAALSGRAGCYLNMGMGKDKQVLAVNDIDSCLSINGQSSDGYCKKGLLFLQQKDTWNAKAMFKKAIELNYDNKEAAVGYRKCTTLLDQDFDQARIRSNAQPWVQKCLKDPKMLETLKLMEEDPMAARRVFGESVEVREGLHTLVQSGAIMFR